MKIPVLIGLLLCVGLLLHTKQVKAQFPYSENFTQGSVGSSSVFGNSSTLTDGVLRLTNNQASQKGYFFVNNTFSSAYGLKATFEYYCYGGTGADGIAFFLFDGAVNQADFRVGAFGGSLGYAQRNSDLGLKGAYIGIGFDAYGNFGNDNENKVGRLVSTTARVPNSVIIRGRETDDYKFIAGKETNFAPLNLAISSSTPNRVTDSSLPGYRKVYIELEPLAVGYHVTVKMDIGGAAGTKTILATDYPYPAPPTLKIGFSASTGGSTNYHEIDNVLLEVSDEDALADPLAYPDTKLICSNETSVTVNVLSNDILTNSGPTYFNTSTLDLNPSVVGIQTSFTQPGKGTFTANPDGSVGFVKDTGFDNALAEAYYTITDNYGKTSSPVKIVIDGSTLFNLQVAGSLKSCGNIDLRQAISGDHSEYTMSYFKSANNTRTPKSELAISNIRPQDSGTYIIKAESLSGCIIEKAVEVEVFSKPDSPALTIL